MSTPHISAEKGAFAKTVLMPGDPLRSKFIAETFLTDAKLVNNVRGVQGYTGTYQGVPVSVMASGMGIPSMGIYSYELFNFYDVDNIIRIGSAGAMKADLKLMSVVAAMGACTDSNYARQYDVNGVFTPIADYTLLETAVATAREMDVEMAVGNVACSEVFYDNSGKLLNWAKLGVLCAEMESVALYCNAAAAGKRALTLLTISDNIVTEEKLSAEERQLGFTKMMEIALKTAVKMAEK
ncbi:MAG: purine-nucleoside phosphorylase [Ruminococcaceae bacterium]|nr:purine-nucleoside phosphorylase [Oscillospiraceae bacterium]